jgi:hypothetical protein
MWITFILACLWHPRQASPPWMVAKTEFLGIPNCGGILITRQRFSEFFMQNYKLGIQKTNPHIWGVPFPYK